MVVVIFASDNVFFNSVRKQLKNMKLHGHIISTSCERSRPRYENENQLHRCSLDRTISTISKIWNLGGTPGHPTLKSRKMQAGLFPYTNPLESLVTWIESYGSSDSRRQYRQATSSRGQDNYTLSCVLTGCSEIFPHLSTFRVPFTGYGD